MAKKRKKRRTAVTPHNTGLSIARNGNKFTATWKIASKNLTAQKLAWRTYNGKKWSAWHYVKLSKSATSYSITLSPTASITYLAVATSVKRAATTSYVYKASAYSSSMTKYHIVAPPAPSVSVSNDSANKTTFSWSASTNATSAAWFDAYYYRTRTSSGSWSAWTRTTGTSYTVTDTEIGISRILEVRTKGPGGYSAIRSASHYIGPPPIATWGKTPVTYSAKSSYYSMTYSINLSGSTTSVDQITPQYFIGKPDQSIAPDSGASWQDGTNYFYRNGRTAYSLAVTTDSLVGADECLWARVKTTHDGIDVYSTPYRVITGRLTTPTATVTITQSPTAGGFTISVDLESNTDVPGVIAEVYLMRNSNPSGQVLIGTVANGESPKTIASKENIVNEKGYAIRIRNVSADRKTMTSDYYEYKVTMPAAPTLKSVSATTTSGKVLLEWTHNWPDATGAIVAWADDPDNWQSNDEPDTFEITEKASSWFITGLETGQKWYFRVRGVRTENDTQMFTSWSNEIMIDLASAPAIPVLYLSESAITENGMVTAYWSYVTTDGTAQIAGEIVTATYKTDHWEYGNPVGAVTDAQHVDIYAKDQGWKNGTIVNLALRTRSGSGGLSEYSTPIELAIAALPTVAISKDGLSQSLSLVESFLGDGQTTSYQLAYELSAAPTVTVDGESVDGVIYEADTVTLSTAPAEDTEIVVSYTTGTVKVLTELPLTVEVTSSNAASLSVAIERAEDYPMLRPDGEITDGAAGETVYLETVSADESGSFTIELADLIGRIDDGAYYNLVASVADNYGQTAETSIRFIVNWGHQAWEPTAQFIVDDDELMTYITPIAGEGYEEGDTCDIYRLGADAPELIYSGARFGTEYVDPYTAFGPDSGYKIVTVTKFGDYITPDNRIADFDTIADDDAAYGQLYTNAIVIDYGGEQVELPYNISLSNSWKKDFERTKYLGGHIAGDHNRGVLRDLTAETVLVRDLDNDTAAQVRALARYEGVCHVRTPEGSSFAADVQVSEDRSYDSAQIDYSFNIQKVDSVGFDAMTLAEWEELRE